jgi:hypothetical protein
MAGAYRPVAGSVRAVEGMEDRLADTLTAASDEIAHSECLDPEQRAEVYAILDAIQADTKDHRKTITLLSRKISEADANA